jgi:hypothetical protein
VKNKCKKSGREVLNPTDARTTTLFLSIIIYPISSNFTLKIEKKMSIFQKIVNLTQNARR